MKYVLLNLTRFSMDSQFPALWVCCPKNQYNILLRMWWDYQPTNTYFHSHLKWQLSHTKLALILFLLVIRIPSNTKFLWEFTKFMWLIRFKTLLMCVFATSSKLLNRQNYFAWWMGPKLYGHVFKKTL